MSQFQVLGNQDGTFAINLRQTEILVFFRRIAKFLEDLTSPFATVNTIWSYIDLIVDI